MSSQFVDEVESGDRLRGLKALRAKIAAEIEVCTDGRELAALALRLQRVLAEIHELGGQEDKEDDELAARRDAKLSASGGP